MGYLGAIITKAGVTDRIAWPRMFIQIPMKHSLVFRFIILVCLIQSCNTSPKIFETEEGQSIRLKVDEAVIRLDSTISRFSQIVRIDHSRLAEGEGVYTPPAIVTIFSNPEVNSRLIQINPLAGIDLPYKVLCYSEPELVRASIAYTSPEFIMQRHGLSQNDLTDYTAEINSVIKSFPGEIISATDLSGVDKNFGLVVRRSDFDFQTTLGNLMKAIQGQGDTEIFGEIDFQSEAGRYEIEVRPTTLILFGAPEPGGKAMNKTPKLGLDAFCQKLLVFEKENGVFIAYNDIVAFSELYYDTSTIPQRVINHRLKSVFEEAITE